MRSLTRVQLSGAAVVMVGSFIAALDQSIVGTAMPTVIGELGGLDRYSLVFSAYLLVATVTTPLVGRLADLWGRRPLYLGGLFSFMLGSLIAGLAVSMEQLIVARAIQGLGAGILVPVGMTIVGDLFDVRMRARAQPLFSSVWVIGALLGPGIGGVLTQTLSWRWAFLINLPIGVIAAALLLVLFKERGGGPGGAVDWSGAIVFTIATTALLVALSGAAPLWVLAVAVIGGGLFAALERRSATRFLDVSVLRRPAIGPGIILNAVVGAMTLALVTYLPPFVQGVLGAQPVEAGLVLSASSIGWTAGSLATSFLVLRYGPRMPALCGTLMWIAGAGILALLGAGTPLLVPALAAILLGAGMGFTINPILISAQSDVGWGERGTVTSMVHFSRNIGAAVGVAALGGLMFATMGGAQATADASALLSPVTRPSFTGDVQAVQAALASALHAVFLAMIGLSVVGVLLARRLPSTLVEKPHASR